MIKTKIVNGFFRRCFGAKFLEDEINLEVEDLEREGYRVRDVKIFTVQPRNDEIDGGLRGYGVIFYDDSVLYSPDPEEIGDLYHRAEKKEAERYRPNIHGQGATH